MKNFTLSAVIASITACLCVLQSACTPAAQNAAEQFVVAVTPATCTFLEQVTGSPFVTAVCDVIDPKTGGKVGKQSVQLAADSPLAVELKKVHGSL